MIDVAVHPEWAPLGAARFKQARTARSDCNTNEVQTYSGWVSDRYSVSLVSVEFSME